MLNKERFAGDEYELAVEATDPIHTLVHLQNTAEILREKGITIEDIGIPYTKVRDLAQSRIDGIAPELSALYGIALEVLSSFPTNWVAQDTK
jgi:hypothetical protein